ncbi:toll/interleukin-1 receptor domain-containing protein, partial [Heyndrickxia ginsengihumi]|uniref:toll/interleukin-1 receptor domain-containing protein n=1 Tax=Heyndrickxia ginsengihumi TaxID=363870 RepID=UPI001F434490
DSLKRKRSMSNTIDTIFISHAHKDKEYVEELVKIIKVTRIEEKDVKIICTSVPGYGVPGDENIYEFLSEKLRGNAWVIYLLSNNYYDSAACLNEMGATWVLKKRYSTFVTPNFKFEDIRGAIDIAKNAFKLDERARVNDFKKPIIRGISNNCE